MDVLIVEDEPSLLESLKDGLSAALPAYRFEGAASVEAAESLLGPDAAPPLIISDIRLPGKSGIEFLLEIRGRWPEVRFILMSAFASPLPIEADQMSGVVRFLRKPFDLEQLVEEVQTTLESERFAGSVEGITLVDLLQILNMGKRTAVLRIRRGDRHGEIFVTEGEIMHAELGDEKGVPAFNALLAWRSGAYSVASGRLPPQRTIQGSFGFLLMEALRIYDEKQRDKTGELSKEETIVANINDLCKELVADTPDGVAANVVDLSSGMMLGGHFLSDFTTDHFEAVSAAATNLYRGKETLRVENLVKAQRGDSSDQHFMEEVQFATTHLLHFIVKVPDKEAVLCLVTRKPGNIGMGWSAVRAAVPNVVPLIPS